jgi:flagellin
MGMRITTNLPAITAQRLMTGSQREMSKSMSQLASGSRINKSADDAAGLAISESLRSQIRSFSQASRNANDGISLVQVAEGGLVETSNILTRLRELGIQAASDTVGEKERVMINNEVVQMTEEIERISQTTRFGDTVLLDGSGGQFDFQVGINNDDFADRISYDAGEANASAGELGVDGLDFSSKSGAQEALAVLDEAQSRVNGFRATLGALQNRLQSTVENTSIMHESLSAANSRIRDTDVAAASSELARNQILLQASAATLAQANQVPAIAMKLIG